MSVSTEIEPSTDDLEPQLTPKLSPRWALKPQHLAVVVGWCLFFLVLNYLPLRGTDLWGHAAYGKWILQHHSLPAEDPLAPLTAGMRVVDSAWLSQVTFGLVERWGGAEGLSNLFAVTVLATFLILARTFFLQSRRLSVSIIGTRAVLVVGWSRLATIRPENFGALLFAVLLWLIVSSERSEAAKDKWDEGNAEDKGDERLHSRWRWQFWLGVPLVMCVWANLHGSFVCGLAVLGCYFAGRMIEVAWRTRSLQAIVADRSVRRWLYACELGVAATLLNPYGIDLLLYSLFFSGNQNLRDVMEWQPLVIVGVGGIEFALSWVVLLVVLRHSRRRVPVAHGFLLGLFAVAAVLGVRMLGWYAAAFALVITPHVAELWARYRPAVDEPEDELPSEMPLASDEPRSPLALPRGRAWSYSLVSLLVIWITFALAPIGRPVVGDQPRSPDLLYDNGTPLGVTKYLRENPPQGQLFNPQWWGDWLAWDGPPGIRPFMTTNMHLVPRQVWKDYMGVMGTQPGWQAALDRYRVEMVVVDKERQATLERLLKRSSTWKTVYEDKQALIVTRAKPAQATNAAEDADKNADGSLNETSNSSDSSNARES
jgi:hypothetical protein